jgi:arginine utilization protein RocB
MKSDHSKVRRHCYCNAEVIDEHERPVSVDPVEIQQQDLKTPVNVDYVGWIPNFISGVQTFCLSYSVN